MTNNGNPTKKQRQSTSTTSSTTKKSKKKTINNDSNNNGNRLTPTSNSNGTKPQSSAALYDVGSLCSATLSNSHIVKITLLNDYVKLHLSKITTCSNENFEGSVFIWTADKDALAEKKLPLCTIRRDQSAENSIDLTLMGHDRTIYLQAVSKNDNVNGMMCILFGSIEPISSEYYLKSKQIHSPAVSVQSIISTSSSSDTSTASLSLNVFIHHKEQNAAPKRAEEEEDEVHDDEDDEHPSAPASSSTSSSQHDQDKMTSKSTVSPKETTTTTKKQENNATTPETLSPPKTTPKEETSNQSKKKRTRNELAKQKQEELQKILAEERHQKEEAKGDVSSSSSNKKKKVKPTKPLTTKRLTNGVVIQDLIIGSSSAVTAKKGRLISINYIGTLVDTGKVFDKNSSRSNPLQFRLGTSQVIRGLDVGIEGMKVGGQRTIKIPSSMAYGTKGAPPKIPPNATLEFDVTLVG